MIDIDVELVGEEHVIFSMNALGLSLLSLPGKERVAAEYSRTAARIVPKRTGALAKGFRPVHGPNVAAVVNDVRYEPYVNFGTRRTKATHYRTKVDAMLAPLVVRTVDSAIQNDVRKLGL